MRNHPLYNRVCKIIERKAKDKSIRHCEFSQIRSQESVRAILAFEGYKPNSPTLISRWSLDKFETQLQEELAGREPIKVEKGMSLVSHTRKLLLSGEEVFMDEILISRKHFLNLVGKYRKEGYKIHKRTYDGSTRALSYRLETKKP